VSEFEGGSDDFVSSSSSNDASDFSEASGSDGGSDSDNDGSDGGKSLPLPVSERTDKLIIGDDWDELERKAAKGNKFTFSLICTFLNHLFIADQKNVEGKKAAGSDGSDNELAKKKSNGKAKSKRK